uniref:EB domain-containing protein n=1 Tax=Ascaris lumbricoides TaxID=6252 RepID=A0A0M3HXD2_ASCLU
MRCSKMRSLHFVLSFVSIHFIVAQLPVYEYLKELCPPNLTVMTREDHIIKCSEICPSGAICIKGVCCRNASIAKCRSTIFRYSIGLACFLSDPNSCPPGTRCIRSTIFSIHLCCSESAELNICPGTHPIPQLIDGILAICNSETTCRKGYVCTNSKASQGTCCSLPTCSDGQRAKRRCKTTCPRGQRCTKIGNANWCCNIPSTCSSLGNREGVGACRRESDCASGFTCREHQNPSGISRCCVHKPRCPDSTIALIRHGKAVQCFIHGSPCMTVCEIMQDIVVNERRIAVYNVAQ